MKSYGLQYWQNMKNFSYRAMCYTLIHEQPAISAVWRSKPEWKECKDIKQLEQMLWGFDWENMGQ